MSILTDTYLLSKLCEASGFPTQTAKSHLRKNYLVGVDHPITGGADTGKKRRFHFTTIIQAAVAKEQINMGVAPDRAFKSAIAFAHSGSKSDDPTKNRKPGLPFNTGTTLLLVWNGGETVVCETTDMTVDKLRNHVPLDADDNRVPFLTIPCNPIFDRVATVLGYHPDAVLEEAYGS